MDLATRDTDTNTGAKDSVVNSAPNAQESTAVVSDAQATNNGNTDNQNLNAPDAPQSTTSDRPLLSAATAPQNNAVATDVADTLQYPAVDVVPAGSSDGVSNARDLTASDWKLVMRNNSLLHGFHIREVNQDIVRARQNAFVLKGSDQGVDIEPYFQVEDGSSIQIQETKNAFQRSLAQNAFSKRCVESSLSAGDFGIMAGISGKREHETSKSGGVQKTDRDQDYYAVFNFPRARLLLDEEELQLSEKCKAALTAMRSMPSIEKLERFYKLFGHVFVTSVLLGGQQRTSKFAAAIALQDEEVQQDALRSALGAKINAQYVSASVTGSRETDTSQSQSNKQYTNLSYLGMSASGGNTLIGSNIPEWAHTVAPFKNWRVIENEIAIPIQELIGKVAGWEDIPELFKEIRLNQPVIPRPWKQKFSFLMDGKPLCWEIQDNIPRLRPSRGQGLAKAIFLIREEPPAKDSQSDIWGIYDLKLRPDWPIFLHAIGYTGNETEQVVPIGMEPMYQEKSAWGLMKPVSTQSGITYPCRFSLRLAGQSGTWDPKSFSNTEIKSGDQVNLYCHSMGLGPFANIDRPPSCASPAVSGVGDPSLVFFAHDDSFSPSTRSLSAQYDNLDLSAAARKAFEKMGFISNKFFMPEVQVDQVKPGSARSRQAVSTKEYAKQNRIDYMMLQEEPYKSMPLDWTGCQMDVAFSRHDNTSTDSSTQRLKTVEFQINLFGASASFRPSVVPVAMGSKLWKTGRNDSTTPAVLTVIYE